MLLRKAGVMPMDLVVALNGEAPWTEDMDEMMEEVGDLEMTVCHTSYGSRRFTTTKM